MAYTDSVEGIFSRTFSRAPCRLTLADRQDSEAAWDGRRQALQGEAARAGSDPGDRAPEFVTMFRGPRAKVRLPTP